ncbi:FHA domain-containing protein, partial [Streptomyces sp. DT225]
MQIRLTVVDPLGASAPGRDRAPRSDVLVTAPAGTALAAVASALAQVVAGGDGSGTPVLYAGEQRLDAQRCTLGEPPLTDGAVLSVGAPGEPEPHPEWDDAPAQLQVVAGPDAGGVHLLHGGEIRIGRSADADVPLDDPDVSRLHCTVTVGADGRVSVADLDSTNGTTLDGTRVGGRAVRFAPGALLRIGESALRLAPAGGPGGRVETTPDGEGHVRVPGPAAADGSSPESSPAREAAPRPGPAGPSGPTQHTYGAAAWGTRGASEQGSGEPVVPGQGGAPRIEGAGRTAAGEGPRPGRAGTAHGSPVGLPPEGSLRAPRQRGAAPSAGGAADTHAGRSGVGTFGAAAPDGTDGRAATAPGPGRTRPGAGDGAGTGGRGHAGTTHTHGTGHPGADAGYGTGPAGADTAYGTGPAGADTAYGTGHTGAETAHGTGPAGADTAYGTGPAGAETAYGTAPASADARYGTGPAGADTAYGTGPAGAETAYGTAPASADAR